MPEADVQVLPADGRKCFPFRRVLDKSGIDDMGVEFAVRVAAQALDDSPLAQDVFGLLEKIRKWGGIHVAILLHYENCHRL
jgi:hypothetical protein